MKLSTKFRYGTRAVLELARNFGNKPITRKQIAAEQGISPSYLENILIELKNRGIIKATRGAGGGLELALPPHQVTMFEIAQILEGVSPIVDCTEDATVCERSKSCVTRKLWQMMQRAQREVLDGITLEDLVEMETADNVIDYSI